MKSLLLTFILLATTCFAQTRSIVPNQPGQGSIGRTNKMWASGYFEDVFVNGTNLESRISSNNVFTFNALTGSVELVAGDGVQIVTNGNQLTVKLVESPISAIGTNRVYFQYTGYTNYWTVPAGYSNVAVWAWGGGSGGAGNGTGGQGGFTYATGPVTGNQNFAIIVGGRGDFFYGISTPITVIQGGWPNGGSGVSRYTNTASGGVSSGGGMSAVKDYESTNWYVVAGGGGGVHRAGFGNSYQGGGSGGGLAGRDGNQDTTSPLGGGGGGANQIQGGSTVESSSALLWTNTAGSFLQGGSGGVTTNILPGAGGGGGGGWYGGGGGRGSGGNGGAGGGGGSGYVNQELGFSGITLRAIPTVSSVINQYPIGTDTPEYISPSGVAGYGSFTNGYPGLIVIGY